jgi:hypothetical protein
MATPARSRLAQRADRITLVSIESGQGQIAVGFSGVHFAVLGRSFILPLLLSPVMAMSLTMILYPIARLSRRALGVERESCICASSCTTRSSDHASAIVRHRSVTSQVASTPWSGSSIPG